MAITFKKKPFMIAKSSYVITIPKEYFNNGTLNPNEEITFIIPVPSHPTCKPCNGRGKYSDDTVCSNCGGMGTTEQ